jgi:hypothetical protein
LSRAFCLGQSRLRQPRLGLFLRLSNHTFKELTGLMDSDKISNSHEGNSPSRAVLLSSQDISGELSLSGWLKIEIIFK